MALKKEGFKKFKTWGGSNDIKIAKKNNLTLNSQNNIAIWK